MRDDFPELVRKTILHKWEVDGKECWIKGKVLKAVGDINDIACMFEVKYEDEEENKDVALYEDYKNNDLVVLWIIIERHVLVTCLLLRINSKVFKRIIINMCR